MSDNSLSVFNTSINISQIKHDHPDAVWPVGVDICIARLPIRKRDGYTPELMKTFAQRLKNSVSKNGIVYLICYAPSEAKSRPFEVAKEMVEAGFTHIDNIIIEKTWLPGKRAENTLVNSHDYVLWFCNGNVWKIDREPLRKYLMLDESAPCIGNTWLVETGSLDEAYSDDLAEILLRMADCLPGSSVFDPFMSNSAIVRACLKLGHSLSGFEMNDRKLAQYTKIIDDFSKTRSLK
jgi:hypothetical protein